MKKYILTLALAVLLVPSFSHAQTVTPPTDAQAQYIQLLTQLVSLLEQELQIVLASQNTLSDISSTTSKIAANTAPQSTSIGNATIGTATVGGAPAFTVYKLVYEPKNSQQNDIYYLGNEQLDPASVQLTNSSGDVVQTTFMSTDSRDMSQSCFSIPNLKDASNTIRVCDGQMMRIKSSVDLPNDTYTVTLKSISGDSYTGSVTVYN